MATLSGGAGGKIVTNRRRRRLVTTPYDRPPPPAPPSTSPNWFTGVLIPRARAVASGAGKILSAAIFFDSESSSSSSEESDFALEPEDDIDNVNENKSPYDQINALNEEYFSREECDRMTKVLNSRVMDWSTEAGEEMSFANSPEQTAAHEDVNVPSKAVMEEKKWLQEKKAGSSAVVDLPHGTCNPTSTVFNHVESGVGSPVHVARYYMRNRPPWSSPKDNVELRTPSTTTMKLFKEGSPYSANHDALSSSKRRNSHASGSWNIQEELRKVRSKAIDDMLRSPPAKIDSSLFAVAPIREQSAEAGKVIFGAGERISELHSSWKTKPTDALRDIGVSSDPAIVALESRHDGKDKASEGPSSYLDASISGKDEDSEAIPTDSASAPHKSTDPSGPKYFGEQHTDPHSTKMNRREGKHCANGFSESLASLSPGDATVQKNEQHAEENHDDNIVSENREKNVTNDEDNCELLSDTYMEVPIANETNSIASDSQISLDVQYDEAPVEIIQLSMEEKVEASPRKQQGRKPGKYSRRGRGRGRGKLMG